jgi:hypothetical protein
MKHTLYTLIISLLMTTTTLAQEEQRGITAAEFASAKTIVIKNLEKDSYVKANGFVLDRNEEQPPYVFKFSDGVERRIYRYNLHEAEGMKQLGSLAVYHTPKDGKSLMVCIPNNLADKAIWGQYIDDLKDHAKVADGFAVCMAFMLSKENAGKAKTADGTTTASTDHNEFCFPGDAHVLMQEGLEKRIDAVKVGDYVGGMAANRVTRVTRHTGTFALMKVLLEPTTAIWASNRIVAGFIELEATPNHPILTLTGRKPLGTLQPGDMVLVEDAARSNYQLAEVKRVLPNARTVQAVYNLHTGQGLYQVNDVLVLDK